MRVTGEDRDFTTPFAKESDQDQIGNFKRGRDREREKKK